MAGRLTHVVIASLTNFVEIFSDAVRSDYYFKDFETKKSIFLTWNLSSIGCK